MRVRCKSGLKGWCNTLQSNYEGGFEEFQRYCETYGLHLTLGFHTAEDAWDANPVVEGSVDTSDYRISPPYRRKLVMASLRKVNSKYGRALKNLAD